MGHRPAPGKGPARPEQSTTQSAGSGDPWSHRPGYSLPLRRVASTRVAEFQIAVAFGILGLTSLIYSLLFLVAQWAFSSLSPRLNLFRDDPIVWRIYELAIGIFVSWLGASAHPGIAYSE